MKDINDRLKQGGPLAVRNAIDGAKPVSLNSKREDAPRKYRLPAIVSGWDGWDEPDEPDEEVIKGLLTRGSKMVFGSSSKAGKTWAMTALAVAVASGGKWLGHEARRGKVLYLNFELKPKTFRRRLKWVAGAMGADPDECDALDVVNLRGHGADFSQLLPAVAAEIRGKDYAVVIIDPVYRGLGHRNENAAGDIADLLNEVERLVVDSGASVIVTHHFSKGNKSESASMDRVSGSGVWARDPDTLLTFTPHEEDDAFTVEATIRDLPPVEPFVARWEFPIFRPDAEADPSKLKKAGPARTFTADMLVDAIDGKPVGFAGWFQAVKAETGMSETTFRRLRKEALESGEVIEDEGGFYRRKEGA